MGKRGKHFRTKHAWLKSPLWLGVPLLLIGIMAWSNLTSQQGRALPPIEAISNTAEPQRSEVPLQTSSTPQSEIPLKSDRVPVLEDIDGYPVMARLVIEAIQLDLPVIAELSNSALKTAPCLYAGPGTPEDAGNIVIVGHNYRNDSHFGRLDELQEGDAVWLTDKYGGQYCYTVSGCEIIRPEETDALDDYAGDHALSLVTCTPDGENRLLVRCGISSSET